MNWRLEMVDSKLTKVPYQVNGYKAKSTDPETWANYDDVVSQRQNFDGIGIVFDGGVLGVDLDHVLLNDTTIIDAASAEFVSVADSYTEISPSGTGLHIYFILSDELKLTAHAYKPSEKFKYEAYNEKRYFTVTENIYRGHSTMRTITAAEAIELLAILGYPWKKEEEKIAKPEPVKNALPEEKILNIMFKASNGVKMKKLWEGDISTYANDDSAADMALVNMFAFYSGKNAEVMERLWLASPLGKREKTQQRKDYRDRTIAAAIAYTAEVFTADHSYDHSESYITQRKGKADVIVLCTENIQIFLDSYKTYRGRFRFDEFKQCVEYRRLDTWERLRDIDAIQIQAEIARTHPAFAMVSKQMTHDAILSNAERHTFDSAKEYFKSLKWDQKPRLDSWLTYAFGVEDNEYHHAIGSNWLKGIAKRIMIPGCKFDYVLVLEGPQGAKKSMAIGILGGDWHAETVLSPDNKDFFLVLLGNMIVEFSEGETLSRSEVKKLKSVITMQYDSVRLPYAREVGRYPRRCVFAMTTNEDKYLKDDTGNRRWLPVKVEKAIDIEWLRENRDQLFAEAYHRAIVLKENTWDFPKEIMEEEQQKRVTIDPKSEKIQEWYLFLSEPNRAEGVTTREAYMRCFAGKDDGGERMTKGDEMSIASIFKRELKLTSVVRMTNGVRRNMFIPTEKTPLPALVQPQGELVPAETIW